MSWLDAALAPRVFAEGVESTPRRGAYDFYGFTVVDDPATGRKRIYNTNQVVKGTVDAATTTTLPSYTRTGNTITATVNGALANQDGVTPFVGMRILVWKESTQANNGIWKVRQVGAPGAGGTPYIADRDTDADENADFSAGSVWPVRSGSLYGGRSFVLSIPGGFVLNTSAITFALYATPGVYDVRAFGAVGDGTTNDTTARDAAVAACIGGGGGMVYYGPGTYSVDNHTVSNAAGVRIVGAGSGKTIIKARQTGQIVTFSGCTECSIEDIAIERRDSLFQTAGGYALAFVGGCLKCSTKDIRISYATAGILVQRSYYTHLRGRTLVDHLTAGGGSAALRFVGENGVGLATKCDVDWLAYDFTSYSNATHTVKTYAATTAYSLGDIVFVNDRYWECTTAGTSGSSTSWATNIPGSDGPTAYTTGVTDGTVTWKFLIGNSFIVSHDFGAHDLDIRRFDCVGPCTLATQMWRSTGTDTPSGLKIQSGRIEGTISNAVVLDRGSRVRLALDIVRTWSGRGLSINTNFGGDVDVSGRIEKADTNGVTCDSGGVNLHDLIVTDCSRAGSGVHAGILVQAVNDVRVSNCKSSGSLQSYGLTIAAGADQFVILGNYFLGNATGGINNGAGTSATKVVANNI